MKLIWKMAVSVGLVTILSFCVTSCEQKLPGTDTDKTGEGDGNEDGDNTGGGEEISGDAAVKTFFMKSLAGSDGVYSYDKVIAKDEVEDCRTSVWKIWKTANLSYQDEDKLPGLPTLGSSTDVFTWAIPKSLEGEYINGSFTGNDSKMTFHWG